MTAILTQTRFGPMLVPPYDIYLARAMIQNREYAPAEFDTWRPYLREGGLVLDVGANFGAHTLAFADAVGPSGLVFAFEPQRALYHMLCGSVVLCDLRNVEPQQIALGRTPGHVYVPPMDYAGLNNFGGIELGQRTEGDPVRRIPLDSLGLKRADFVKIDVEGMELEVLEGARETIARCRPVLSVEADREPQVPALLEFLRAANYHVWWHRPPLGDQWPNIVSTNLLALPAEVEHPEPTGDVERA